LSEVNSPPPEFTVNEILNKNDSTVFLHSHSKTELERRQFHEWFTYLSSSCKKVAGIEGYRPDGGLSASTPSLLLSFHVDVGNSDHARFSTAEEVVFRREDQSNKKFAARGLACFTARRESISFTLRDITECSGQQNRATASHGVSEMPYSTPEVPYSASEMAHSTPEESYSAPEESYSAPEIACSVPEAAWSSPKLPEPLKYKAPADYIVGTTNYWFSIEDQCQVLHSGISELNLKHPQGLVVLCGSTNSSKSLIARGLIHRFLEARRHVPGKPVQSRRPHLVTFEDPIEKFFISSEEKELRELPKITQAGRWGVDYTPREKGPDKDVPNLKQAFADALRQTPAVFYIGEVRDRSDWVDALEFAGTGHLVITTAHAGSLLEMMMKILSAVGADIPARRRLYAGKILSVIHLKSFGSVEGRELLLPSFWRNTEQSLATLTASGFAGIIPTGSAKGYRTTGSESSESNQKSCCGRHALLELLLDELRRKHIEEGKKDVKVRKPIYFPDDAERAELTRLARSDDL
jgi:hypothetical protein